MLKISYISLLFLWIQATALNAQTRISGEISSAKSKVITVNYWKDFVYRNDTIKLDRKDSFSTSYQFTIPMYIRIEEDNNVLTPFMLIYPGENLHIKLDKDSTLLTGSASAYNSFIVNLRKSVGLKRQLGQDSMLTYALDQSCAFFKTFRHENSKAIENLTIQNLIGQLKLYPLLMKYSSISDSLKIDTLKSIVKTNRLPETAGNEWLYLDEVNYNNETNKYDHEYLNWLNNFIRITRFHATAKNQFADTDAFLIEKDIIRSIFPASPLRTALLAFNLHFRIKNYTEYPYLLADVDKYITEFSQEIGSKEYMSAITRTYTESKSFLGNLAKGAKAPNFNLKDLTGKSVSIKDFKGKVVYLDIWASWCGPCLKEMPYIKVLKEKYKDQQLEIISISIDTKQEAWKKKISDLNLTGIQLIDDLGSTKSKIAKDYRIAGVPHFVLIDKNGKIASASAPLPSNTKLEEEINKLLK
ncbi:MAG TPA: redoxin family protein [Pedobacter sp.]|jgi:thiol-disulfide isomerase/thioredoxin